MIAHWKPNARRDWNRAIHYLEVTFGASFVNESIAARFRWSELEVAHMMLPQPEPLFGLRPVCTSMLVLRIDFAFKTGDLWTVIDAPLSVAVFPIFTPVPHLGDHNWLHLTCREVSPAFHLVVLRNGVKERPDSLAVEFVRMFPLSSFLSVVFGLGRKLGAY